MLCYNKADDDKNIKIYGAVKELSIYMDRVLNIIGCSRKSI